MSNVESTLSCINLIISEETSDLEAFERQIYNFDTHGVGCKEFTWHGGGARDTNIKTIFLSFLLSC